MYKALKSGQASTMNDKRIARLEAVGFQWDRTEDRGRYRGETMSRDADTAIQAAKRKAPGLATVSRGPPTLCATPQHDGVDVETPGLSDRPPTDRHPFSWCARALLGHSLPLRVGYGADHSNCSHDKDHGLLVAENTLGESAASRKRHGAHKEVSGKSRPAKVPRLKQGEPPPQQQQQRRRLAAQVLPVLEKSSTDLEIVI
jgi:hypothetical protein